MDRRGEEAHVWDGRPGVDSYVAWDGSRYTGPPPAGWYLASDHRWWPTTDIIEAGDGEVEEPAWTEAEATAERTPRPAAVETGPVSVEPEPEDLSDWAPSSAPPRPDSTPQPSPTRSAPAPIGPGRAGSAGGNRPRRSSGGRGATRAGATFFFLAIAFARCALDTDSFDEPTSLPPDFTIPTLSTLDLPEGSGLDLGEELLLVEGVDYAIDGIDCAIVDRSITVWLSNLAPLPRTFEIELNVSGMESPELAVLPAQTLVVGPIDPGGLAGGTIELDPEIELPVVCDVEKVRLRF